MAWLELSFAITANEELVEIFTAQLAEIGFDSFLIEETTLKAYVDEGQYNAAELDNILCDSLFESIKLLENEPLPDKNWNEIWEADYQPAVISTNCRVRAPFHEPDPSFEFDLLIEPRMSFGTAHHETTSQMMKLMLGMDFYGKSVLDMGAGTAVLAILARKMGASTVMAVDNDEWAFNNALDNIVLNHVDDIRVVLGDASIIGSHRFDVVIANINRNILLNDMESYVKALNEGGCLMMSGFYEADLPAIRQKATALHLDFLRYTSDNQWVAAVFKK